MGMEFWNNVQVFLIMRYESPLLSSLASGVPLIMPYINLHSVTFFIQIYYTPPNL